MSSRSEKRAGSRYPGRVPISCGYVNQAAATDGVTANCSRDGLYFQSRRPFTPGGLLRIQTPGMVLKENTGEEAVGLPYMTVAEVRWCRQVEPDADRYDVGVRYLHLL